MSFLQLRTRGNQLYLLSFPTVLTVSSDTITATTANGNGNVVNSGGSAVTERGIVWSTNLNPTTADSKVTAGSGTGAFTGGMTGLTALTLYHFRAYAINAIGTSYGDDMTFTTTAGGAVAVVQPRRMLMGVG